MHQYMGTVLFDDPDLGKTAYAYIKMNAQNQSWGELLDLERIGDHLSYYPPRSQEDNTTGVLALKKAQQDLAQLGAAENLHLGVPPFFNDMPGVFASDGLAIIDVPPKGQQVFALLRQKLGMDMPVFRRVLDMDSIRVFQSIFENYFDHFELAERQKSLPFPKKYYGAAASLLKEVLVEGEARHVALDAAKPKRNSVPPGLSPC